MEGKGNRPEEIRSESEERAVFNAPRSRVLDAFREAVLNSEELQNDLRNAENIDDIVRPAAKHCFGIPEADIKRLRSLSLDMPLRELTFAELETVAGALPCWCDPSVVNSKSCN